MLGRAPLERWGAPPTGGISRRGEAEHPARTSARLWLAARRWQVRSGGPGADGSTGRSDLLPQPRQKLCSGSQPRHIEGTPALLRRVLEGPPGLIKTGSDARLSSTDGRLVL